MKTNITTEELEALLLNTLAQSSISIQNEDKEWEVILNDGIVYPGGKTYKAETMVDDTIKTIWKHERTFKFYSAIFPHNNAVYNVVIS